MDRTRPHPLVMGAAAAVLLFSLLGSAALTGILPLGNTKPAETPAVDARALAGKIPLDHPQAHSPARAPMAQAAQGPCANCGVIESIRAVEVKGAATGVGAVTGGVAGGVLGNQIGRGDVRTLLTIGGAAGGAYAGNEIERNMNRHTVWKVGVRLENGTLRTISQKAQPAFAVGERVRIVDGSAIERA